MISIENLIFIKENLFVINIMTGVFSFFLGIAPLLMERETLERQSKPIIIEFTAFVFLMYTFLILALSYISDRPIFIENNCIKQKEKYYITNEFKDYFYLNDKLLIKKLGDNNYLLLNLSNKIFYKMPISEDFKYEKSSCN